MSIFAITPTKTHGYAFYHELVLAGMLCMQLKNHESKIFLAVLLLTPFSFNDFNVFSVRLFPKYTKTMGYFC